MILTRTLTVNAAFLQEIKADNRDLRRLFDRADDLLTEANAIQFSPKELADSLSALRDQIAIHFSLEESFGYFEDAIEVEPRLSEQADRLKNEHEGLFQKMCDLVEEAERLLYAESPHHGLLDIAHQYAAFRKDYLGHEERENELILLAFDDDIGVGD